MTITIETVEQMYAIADAVLRKHDDNIDRALPEFMSITAAAGLTPNSRTIPQFQPVLEGTARQFLEAYAKEATMTETTTKQRMMAELIFQNMDDANAAIHALTGLGFTTRVLDWTDPCGTLAVWVLAFFDDYDRDDDSFHTLAGGLANEYGGSIIEGGYAPDDVEAWIAKKS